MNDTTDTNDVTLDRFGLEVLPTEVCWNLLRSSPIGRIAFVDAGEPMVFPVTHGVYGRSVVFRSGVGTKLEAAKMAHAVAFEVDEWDSATRTGWSVLARGVAETVYENDAIREFETVGVDPWLGAAEQGDWVRIRVDEISGRRLGQ